MDKLIATTIRMLSIDAVQAANSGHPGLPLGAADIAAVLFAKHLKFNSKEPDWFDRDRFILSAGHGSAMLYSILHLFGYNISLDDLMNFRQLGSVTAGHPELDNDLGIEMTTGPLGQGIATAVGFALAERILAAKLNTDDYKIVDHYTYVLVSDGDLMEGVSHEAASLAGHLGLEKLIVLYDDNKISIDGSTDLAFSEDVQQRFLSYGWETIVVDGHDIEEIDKALVAAKNGHKNPTLVLCRTHIGYQSPMQDTSKVHGTPLGEDGVRMTKMNYGWPPERSFYVPQNLKEHLDNLISEKEKLFEDWKQNLSAYKVKEPKRSELLDQVINNRLPISWHDFFPDFTGGNPKATRATSGDVIEAFIDHMPTVIGGSADLAGSNNTKPANIKVVSKDDYAGSYIHYGVREHGMGAIMNGLALHNLRPYGGTFLVFSDYLRPSIRLAALMNLPVIYVFTHDSIGLGEDGPTHQPIEHLASLRAIPNLTVIRPADGNETASAWKVAFERDDGPTALILSRQKLPQVAQKDNGLELGAYVLREPGNQKADISIIATGSEVEVGLMVAEDLTEQGIQSRVISMPSWELFDAQSGKTKSEVILSEIPCIVIETGIEQGWHKYLGEKGLIIGMKSFGESGPKDNLLKKFGFTRDQIVDTVVKFLDGVAADAK